MSQRNPAGPSAAKAMATSEAQAKGKRPAAPDPLSSMPPAKRANTGNGVSQVPHQVTAPVVVVPTLPQESLASAPMQRGGGSSPASRMQLSRYQAVEKCIPSITEQVIASTDLRWFANSLVEKELIGAQPKSNILQAIGVSDARKVVQLMKSVVVQIKNHPVKYNRFLGVLKEQPVLASLADSIKAVEKTLRTQPTEGQATRRPSTGTPKLGTPPAPKLVTDKPRTKGKRCGECPGCLAQSDCGKCINCKDKRKFGGPGTGNNRKKCIHRQCVIRDMVKYGGFGRHRKAYIHRQREAFKGSAKCRDWTPLTSSDDNRGIEINLEDVLEEEELQEFLTTCERVLRDKDSIDLTAMHGLLLGLPRSGKSSFLVRITGRIPPTFSPSTLAAEKSVQVCIKKMRQKGASATIKVGEGYTFKFVQNLEEEAVFLMNDLPTHPQANASPKRRAANPTLSTNKPELEDRHQSIRSSSSQTVEHSPYAKPVQARRGSPFEGTLKYFKQCLQKRDWRKAKRLLGNPWYLYLTDSGGQPEFQELIPSLVSGPSIFFIIFRLDLDLDLRYKVEFIDKDGRSIMPYMSRRTAFETVVQSFSSVASIEGLSYIQEDGTKVPTKPRVLLVATHMDKEVAKKQITEVEGRFQRVFQEIDKDGIIQWASESQMIFTVDNTLPPDAEDVQRIREKIHSLGTNPRTQREYRVKTPCPWLIFGIIARSPDLPDPDPVMLFNECTELGKGCGIPEQKEMREALGYLDRRIGTLRHIVDRSKDTSEDGSTNDGTAQDASEQGYIEFIIRNPDFLFKVVSGLILETFTFDNVDSKRIHDEFTKKGIFDSDVFTDHAKRYSKKLTPAMLLALLTKLRIIAPIQEEGETQRYFMPCALAHVDAAKPEQQSQPSPVKPLLLRFECGYVPRGLFRSLIAQLLQKQRARDGLQWKLVDDELFRDQITVFLKRNTRIILRMLPTCFSVRLLSPLTLERDHDDLSRICCEVRSELVNSITHVAQVLNYGDRCVPTPCFLCPEVEAGKEEADSHVAVINRDEDGEYLACSQDPINTTWPLEDVKDCSIWLGQRAAEGYTSRQPVSNQQAQCLDEKTLLAQTPTLPELTYLEDSTGNEYVKIIDQVQAHWQTLSHYFQLPPSTRANMQAMPNFGPQMACEEVFRIWLEGGTKEYRQPKEWNTVIKGIERVLNNQPLADEIRQVLTT